MDDGVLRLFDDPDNEEFLKAVKKGYEISVCCVISLCYEISMLCISLCYEVSTVCVVLSVSVMRSVCVVLSVSVMRSVQYVLCISLL